MRRPTEDLRISQTRPLVPPAILHEELPVSEEISEMVFGAREAIANILYGRDSRLVVVVGPCSIHDPKSALEYAEKLKAVSGRLNDKLLLVMRAYFEKPRTTVGWKGFINDPDLNESYNINKGLRLARQLLLDLNGMGVPTASEYLDLQIPQHIADLTSWVAIGARTTESQVHRELASGLSMPVGFKNTTDGSLQPAIDAVKAARIRHWFPSVTKESVSALFHTTGNPDCHVILRGGSRTGPNYTNAFVHEACTQLDKADLPSRVMIDCSHANSSKDYRRQSVVIDDICQQLASGEKGIMGVMLESHLVEGRQDVLPDQPLTYGQSITDSCISWDETVRVLEQLAKAV